MANSRGRLVDTIPPKDTVKAQKLHNETWFTSTRLAFLQSLLQEVSFFSFRRDRPFPTRTDVSPARKGKISPCPYRTGGVSKANHLPRAPHSCSG